MRASVKTGLGLIAALCLVSRVFAQAADSTEIVVAATTDVHGRIVGWDYYANRPDSLRGLSRAATIVDSVRAANPRRVVLVDAGDLLDGNPFAYVAARVHPRAVHPVIAAMNAMHYDAAAIGNHEFNYGLPLLERAIAEAHFPFLAANAVLPSGKAAFASWRIVRRGQVRVAIVGATTPGSTLWDHDNLDGRLVIRDIVPAVRTAVRAARAAGADVVVAALHSGLDEPSSYDTLATHLASENVAARVAHEVAGIDLIVYGHSHREMADTTVNGVLMMQPKNWATSVGIAHLVLRRTGGAKWAVSRKWSSLVRSVRHAESPAIVAAVSAAHAAARRYVETPIGYTTVVWRADSARVRDTPLTDFVLDVEQKAAHADLASTSAFSLDASLDSGAITIAEVARLYPYDNTLKAVRITGKQVRDYLEFSARYFGRAGSDEPAVNPRIPGYNFDIVSGASYTIDVSRAVGSRITSLTVRGRPVADSDTFTMAVNNYRQSGGGGYAMLRGAPVVFDGQSEIRQLLIDAVERRGRLDPSAYAKPNWVLVPAAGRDGAYAAMHRQPPEADVASRDTGASRVMRVRKEPPHLPVHLTMPADSSGHFVHLRIIATNDFHGALDPVSEASGPRGGADAMAATIDRAERDCAPPSCATLLVDAGDLFQGSAASNLAYGAPVVALYNRLGYAATGIGNHEFDWGVDTLRARMKEAQFAILAANVRDLSGRTPAWARDDTILSRGGLRIGVIGVIGPETYHSIMPARVSDLRFDDPAPIIDSLARSLRARGVDAVVVLAHSGAFCDDGGETGCHGAVVDLVKRLTEPVDAIVSGHTHSLVDTRVDRVPVVQARSSGRAVAVLDLAIGPTAARDSVLSHVVLDATANGDPPAAADSIVRAAHARVATLEERPVAALAQAMPRTGSQYALGNLIADAQRWAGKADVAAVNNGGIRQDLPAGTATWGALFAVQPFANTLHRITVPGKALRAYLETVVSAAGEPRSHVSGVVLAFDLSRPAGSRLVSARLDGGGELRDDARYTIVLNDFMATGVDGRIVTKAAIADEPVEPDDLDALVSYLSSRPQPVDAPQESRITISHP
ncbi:MAG TPA: 5'-nucleotidase C-terminal domain-containing protein [Gemmatimonadaceae bacterium]|nr:5'-nucleotidase C-terminal domain-containing protein [Gemmatimonadaceae bacterium]